MAESLPCDIYFFFYYCPYPLWSVPMYRTLSGYCKHVVVCCVCAWSTISSRILEWCRNCVHGESVVQLHQPHPCACRAAKICILQSGRFCTTIRAILRITFNIIGKKVSIVAEIFQICSSEHGKIGVFSAEQGKVGSSSACFSFPREGRGWKRVRAPAPGISPGS